MIVQLPKRASDLDAAMSSNPATGVLAPGESSLESPPYMDTALRAHGDVNRVTEERKHRGRAYKVSVL